MLLCLLCASHVKCAEQVRTLKRVLDSLLLHQVDPRFRLHLSISHDPKLLDARDLEALSRTITEASADEARFFLHDKGAVCEPLRQFEHLGSIVDVLDGGGGDEEIWCGFLDDDDYCHRDRTRIMNGELRKKSVSSSVLLFSRSVRCAHLRSEQTHVPPSSVLPWNREEYVSLLVRRDVVVRTIVDVQEIDKKSILATSFDESFKNRLLPVATRIPWEYVSEKYGAPWMYLYVFDDGRSRPQVTQALRFACRDDFATLHRKYGLVD